ncbi:MAG TPA: aspartate 1-decarboxylase [Bdellovibrionales bacterium]|jgi:aspartate 1-decarboxylase|nr:aspartate 1-decarboxylase [Bdellovibrionales bacterium]
MNITMLKCKIHRATVTDADLNYEGSVSIDPKLVEAAGLREFERVEIYNCNNGNRLATYVIFGKPGEICLNGAAARLVHRGDLVIIAAYASMSEAEAAEHKPKLVFVDGKNQIKELKSKYDVSGSFGSKTIPFDGFDRARDAESV